MPAPAPARRRSCAPRSAGFTLLELLLVVAVMASALALLGGAVGAAHRPALQRHARHRGPGARHRTGPAARPP
ncbi:MAG: prepilin-type N-terminal cleavage/methylation domain-containing protein, partial [Lysobacteraceae bacterium]